MLQRNKKAHVREDMGSVFGRGSRIRTDDH